MASPASDLEAVLRLRRACGEARRGGRGRSENRETHAGRYCPAGGSDVKRSGHRESARVALHVI